MDELVTSLIAAANRARRTSAEERGVRVDEKTLTESFAPHEHPEPHLVAIRERSFCHDWAPAQVDIDVHDDAALTVA